MAQSEQASKQVDPSFLPSHSYFSAIWVVISASYVLLFILGKWLLDSYQLVLIFTEGGYIIFMYHSKTFIHHVSFSISQGLVLQCFM